MSVDFLDTNILIYAIDSGHPAKLEIARDIVANALERGSGVISFQTVQEALQIMTRKVRVVATQTDAKSFLESVLVPLWKVHPSQALYERALTVQEQQGFSFYDSLVVAAALEAGCRRLLTEDLQHGQRIGSLKVENPFRR